MNISSVTSTHTENASYTVPAHKKISCNLLPQPVLRQLSVSAIHPTYPTSTPIANGSTGLAGSVVGVVIPTRASLLSLKLEYRTTSTASELAAIREPLYLLEARSSVDYL